MAKVEIPLPPLGEDAGDHAEVSFWYVEPGETVAEGDNLVQMLTDKATFDVPSTEAGTLAEHVAGEGDDVNTGDTLCVIETEE